MRFGSVRSGRQDPNLAYPPPNSAGPGFFYYNGKGENRNGTLQGVGRQLIYAHTSTMSRDVTDIHGERADFASGKELVSFL